MPQRDHALPRGDRTARDAALIQFFSVNLVPTADGRMSVDVMATLCAAEGELEGVDLGWRVVDSLDEALAVVRAAISPVH